MSSERRPRGPDGGASPRLHPRRPLTWFLSLQLRAVQTSTESGNNAHKQSVTFFHVLNLRSGHRVHRYSVPSVAETRSVVWTARRSPTGQSAANGRMFGSLPGWRGSERKRKPRRGHVFTSLGQGQGSRVWNPWRLSDSARHDHAVLQKAWGVSSRVVRGSATPRPL